MSRVFGWALIAFALATTSSCRAFGGMFGAGDYDVEIGTMNYEPIESVYVIVAKDDALKAENADEIDGLLQPGKLAGFDFFAQFIAVPKDKCWRQGSNVRGKEYVDQKLIEIEVPEPGKAGEIEITFDRDFLEIVPQDGLVVLVQYKESEPRKSPVPSSLLHKGGKLTITIGPSDLKVE